MPAMNLICITETITDGIVGAASAARAIANFASRLKPRSEEHTSELQSH